MACLYAVQAGTGGLQYQVNVGLDLGALAVGRWQAAWQATAPVRARS